MVESAPIWQAAFDAIDSAFPEAARPDRFTDHPYCDECADAHEFFQGHTPATLAQLKMPVEWMPLAFLTTPGYHYFMPAFARMLARGGAEYCLGDILFFLENRLESFDQAQRAALRDLLYLAYDQLQEEIHGTPFDYATVWRLLTSLDGANT